VTENITSAVSALQAGLPTVGKDQKAVVKSDKGSYTYRYADLAAVSAAILPRLSEHGLAWITMPTVDETRFVLRYELRHISGDSIQGAYPLPPPGRPQEMGSAITYARRYTLCAVTGLAPEDDDDNAAAAEKSANVREAKEAAALNLKNSIWAEAKKRGWIVADDDGNETFNELQADFVTWSEGQGIEDASAELLTKYLTHLRPKRTMKRGDS
jgi:hypothetical protein